MSQSNSAPVPSPRPACTYCAPDLDSHGPGQDAERERAALRAALPRIEAKLAWVPSTSGTGWWGLFESYIPLHSGALYNQDGVKIGDFIGIGGTERVPDPGDQPIPVLTRTEVEQLRAFWIVRSALDYGGETWSKRAEEGETLCKGWRHERVPDLWEWIEGLDNLSPKAEAVRTYLLKMRDEAERGERSDATATLAQFIGLHVHKLSPNAGYSQRCRQWKALLHQADSFGKGHDKGYNQHKDEYALIAKCIHEDVQARYGGDRTFKAPFWTKSHITIPTPTPEAPPRPAHRPAGDRAKQVARLERLIRRWLDDTPSGRIYYYIDDLADDLNCSKRSAQNYLHDLEAAGKIKRGQQGGRGGRAYFDVLPAFWDARNSAKPCKADTTNARARDASDEADQRAPMPQTADLHLNAKEDHQGSCAPAPQPSAHAPAGAQHLGAPPRTGTAASTARPLTTRERCELARQHVEHRRAWAEAMAYADAVLSGRIPPPAHLKPWRSEYSPADQRLDEAISVERWDAQAQPPPGQVVQDAIRFPYGDWPSDVWE